MWEQDRKREKDREGGKVADREVKEESGDKASYNMESA